MRNRRLLAASMAAYLVVGCAGAASPPPTTTPASSPATPEPSTATRPAGLGFEGRDAIVVAGLASKPGLMAVQASTGDLMASLPDGVPTGPAWGSLATVSVAANGATTTIADVIVQPDLPEETSIELEGSWALPAIGNDPIPAGLSADSHTLILVQGGADDPGRATSRFAVVPFPPISGAPDLAPRVIELPGALDYDAISPNGRILYVAEHLDGDGGYQVRAVDLPGGVMRDAPIVDKRNLDEEMAGYPLGQVRSPGGLVLTLYRGHDHAFIHALNTAEAWAVCIDLPGAVEADTAEDWGLAASPDWRTVVAVNDSLGLAVDIDPSELVARQTVRIAAGGPVIELAKFGHIDGGPVGPRVVTTTDGSTVFAAGATGVVRLGSDLSVDGRLLEDVSIRGLGLLPDGATLFALLGDGRIVAVDAASGRLVGEVPGSGYDRLAAVVPWE